MSNIQAGGSVYELSLQDDLTRDLKSSLAGAVTTIQGVTRAIDQEVKAIGQSIQGLGRKVAGISAAVGTLGVGASFGFAKATAAAGDFAEVVNMFEAVFKDQSASVRAWGDEYLKQVGRSRKQLLKFLAESQDTFVPLGFDRAEAAELSKTVTKLAIDLGSFKKIADEEALRKLLGALTGITTNLRSFGVIAQEQQIKAKAFDLGFDPKNLTAYQKALAILQITIDGTADAQGDAVRTSDSFVNSIKRLKSSFGDLAIEIGEPFRDLAASVIRGISSVLESLTELLRKFPVVSQITAGIAAVFTAAGAAGTALGGAIIFLGSTVGKATLTLFALDKLGVSLGGVFQKLVAIVGNLRAAFAGLLIRSAIKVAMTAIVTTIVTGLALITKAVIATGAVVMRSLVNPWTLLAAAIVAASEAVKKYYSNELEAQKARGEGLEYTRQRVVAQSFRDAGQAVPADLAKTLNPNNARVVSSDPRTGALSNAQRDLAEEIRALKTPVDSFKQKINDAADLLRRGTITQEQFQKFAQLERESFRRQDPTSQARSALADQLKTPAEKLVLAIREARMLFANDTEMFSRAVREARDQFKATDPAEQLKQQLMTPLEIFRQSVAQARQLFADSPEFLKRAMAAAAETYKASIQQPKDDPAVKAAERIKQALKSDAQKVADQIAQAAALVKRGLLSGDQAKQFGQKLIQDYMGENPAVKELKQFATSSAAIASNIGAFAPSFDNTASEEKAYRKKALELQREIRDALRNQNPVFS